MFICSLSKQSALQQVHHARVQGSPRRSFSQ
jgi:hypothetical protein